MDISKINTMPAGGLGHLPGNGAARDQASASAPQDSPTGRSEPEVRSGAVSTDSVEEAVSTIQEFAQSIRRSLSFNLDDSTGRVVVKVTDSVSGEVIRQIPSEEALKLAESLAETRSLLFKAEA